MLTPAWVVIRCGSHLGLAELVNAEIAIYAQAPQPAHLSRLELDLIEGPPRRWQARLKFKYSSWGRSGIAES